jgi:tetratricopeptide (TPR) repeat protein
MFRSHPFLASIIIVLGVIPALGQVRPAGNNPATRATLSISGSVRDDSSQQVLENVRVDLKQQTGATLNTTFTRGNGEFEFPGLSGGEYVLEVILNGYEPFRETVTLANGSQRGFPVFLERVREVVSKNASESVSAHELSAPQRARDEYEKGMNLLYGKSDFRGALSQFQRAVKDFPDYYEAYAQEGSAYFSLGDATAGEAALKKSIEMSGERYASAFFVFAGMLNNKDRFTEAEGYARKGIALDDASWLGHFELARALTGLKQPEDAEQDAVVARNLKPENPQTDLLLANIHIQRQNYPALLEDLTAYLKLVPTGPEAEQARQTRDKLQAAMKQAPPPPSARIPQQ